MTNQAKVSRQSRETCVEPWLKLCAVLLWFDFSSHWFLPNKFISTICGVMINSQRINIIRTLCFVFSQPAAPVTPAPVTASPQQPAAAPPQPPSSGGSLDSMLGLLQSDLTRQGVQTSSKGNCSACQKPVVGQVSSQNISVRHVMRKTLTWVDLAVCAGGDSSGEGVAPRALRVHRVWDGAGQSKLLREGRAAVLRAGLLHAVLPSLRALQQTHTEREPLRWEQFSVTQLWAYLKSSDRYHSPPKAL